MPGKLRMCAGRAAWFDFGMLLERSERDDGVRGR